MDGTRIAAAFALLLAPIVCAAAAETDAASCGRGVQATDLTGQWLLTLGSSQLEVDDPQLKAQLASVGMAGPPLMPTLDKLDASLSVAEGDIPPGDLLDRLPVDDQTSQDVLYMEALNNEVWFRHAPDGCKECALDGADMGKWNDFRDIKALAQLLKPIVAALPGAEGAYGIGAQKLSELSQADLVSAVEDCGPDVSRIIGVGRGTSKEGHPLTLYYNFQIASSDLLVGVFRWAGVHEGTAVTMTRPAVLSRK